MSKTPQEPTTEAGKALIAYAQPNIRKWLASEVVRVEAEAVEPWRKALANVVNFHDDYSLGCHPCIEARALLDSER